MKYIATIFICASLLGVLRADVKPKPFEIFSITPKCSVILKDEYGVMLVNDGWEKDPSPRYIFACLSKRTLLSTKDLATFKRVLAALPKGSVIHQYGSCTVPRSHGLKQEHFEAYSKVFEDLGLKLDEDLRLTCYCDKTK